ncbi:hypothetical protein XAC908_200013 [Xanthomonas citri pv. citri]|nr:hypothetical protein XAC908_200013 [Xanthomonas citri pv. citri]
MRTDPLCARRTRHVAARLPPTLAHRIKEPVFLAAGGKDERADRTHQTDGARTQGCRRAGGSLYSPTRATGSTPSRIDASTTRAC